MPGEAEAHPLVEHERRASSASQSLPISLQVGPGRTIEARTPVPSSSICSACDHALEPPLAAEYADMNGRARTATSEETKTTSPRRRSTMRGHERPDQPVRADDG